MLIALILGVAVLIVLMLSWTGTSAYKDRGDDSSVSFYGDPSSSDDHHHSDHCGHGHDGGGDSGGHDGGISHH